MKTSTLVMDTLLLRLEQEMKLASIWSSAEPSTSALSSTQPFAVDTLQPEEWLQWVLIAKFRYMIDSQQALPCGFAVTPYFDQVWQHEPRYHGVIDVLKQIDRECA